MRSRIDDREKAIMEAAFALVAERNFEKTPVSEITDRAGVAKGTFYLYFKDKLDLRDQLVATQYADFFVNAYRKIDNDELRELEERSIFVINDIIDQMIESRTIHRLLPIQLNWKTFNEKIVIRASEAGIDIVANFKQSIGGMKQQYKDMSLMLFMIIELVNACCYNALINKTPLDIEKLRPMLLNTIKQVMAGFAV